MIVRIVQMCAEAPPPLSSRAAAATAAAARQLCLPGAPCRRALPAQVCSSQQQQQQRGTMGKAKKTRKFAEVKRMMNPKDLKP